MPAPPLSNTFEGGSDTTTITSGNSGGVSGDAFSSVSGSPTFSITHPAHGNLGVKITDPASAQYLRWSSLGNLTVSTYLRAYLWIPALPTTNAYRPMCYLDSVGGTGGAFDILTSGVVHTGGNSGGSPVNGTVVVPTSSVFRIELRVLPSSTLSGQIECRWWSSPESTGAPDDTVLATSISTTANGNINNCLFGSNDSFPTTPYTTYLDDVAVATAGWIGPSAITPLTNTAFTSFLSRG